ncbi:hypothetical protein Scep_027085 [Stephania cephalantha]|uniref:Rubredoxin-like domain-containing protein n=1 Tax=Stephania cephalantha TaxID=152367 RepID=A0AAP0ELD3_9MAGN
MSTTSSAVVAGASASTISISNHHPLKNTSSVSPTFHNQKTSFQGVALQDAKRGLPNSLIAEANGACLGIKTRRRVGGLEIRARTAGASKNIEVEVDKPLGLALGQKQGGGVVITGVDAGGNAARAGLKVGDQVLYTSSFFGDELWPADKLGFTKTAIQAKPDSVYFVVDLVESYDDHFNLHYSVSRLVSYFHQSTVCAAEVVMSTLNGCQNALPRLVLARATHICLDCGYIYTLQKPFEEQPDNYVCPQCLAPKKRFAGYDVNTGKAVGGTLPPVGVILGLFVGVAGVAALLVYGLQ